MPFLLRNLELNPGEGEERLADLVMARFSLSPDELVSFRVVRKAVDARKKSHIRFIFAVEFTLADEQPFWERHRNDRDMELVPARSRPTYPRLAGRGRIIIAGMGPAGIFAGLRLLEYGLAPIILERGRPVQERIRDIASFWKDGVLNPESNVQFGEGGAGTFSDGKLTTRIRDANSSYVMEMLVRFGAPRDILYLAKPHIGTDRLRRVIVNIRRHLEDHDLAIRFREKVTDIISGSGRLQGVIINDALEEPCDILLLASGNSARDTFAMLGERGIRLEAKPFAVGVRVEHPQELIDRIQYGVAGHPLLPPAEYALTWNDRLDGRSAYSFCMCPGGVVVAAASEQGGVVTNGMSNYRRDAAYANSALVVGVGREDFPDDSPLAGVAFQRALERRAFMAGGGDYRAPAQNLMAFLGDKGSFRIASSYRPGVRETDLCDILPGFVTDTLREGIRSFGRKMRGFITCEATLTGVETRTSSPLRIVRGEDFQSVSLAGLYPVGEGAGYAGGIMSSALDGIRVADAIAHALM
ncbi:MAG TPA: hypothetical protein VMJ66_04980 [Geobacteraceae bacterium]|nr:hypothetical protein [Geobacteraceae bacterium]